MLNRTSQIVLRRRMTLVAVILMLLSTLLITRYEVYHSEVVSPDGRYRAVAHRRWMPSLIGRMPGQGSDSPGSITIYEIATERNLGRRPVAMVSFIADLRWSDDEASIPAVATWPLEPT